MDKLKELVEKNIPDAQVRDAKVYWGGLNIMDDITGSWREWCRKNDGKEATVAVVLKEKVSS